MCDQDIYLLALLSYLYGITIDRPINAPCHINVVVDGLNVTDKLYLKEKMELIGKLASDDTSKIGMLSSASTDVSINFAEQYLQIVTNNYLLNKLKSGTKIQKI